MYGGMPYHVRVWLHVQAVCLAMVLSVLTALPLATSDAAAASAAQTRNVRESERASISPLKQQSDGCSDGCVRIAGWLHALWSGQSVVLQTVLTCQLARKLASGVCCFVHKSINSPSLPALRAAQTSHGQRPCHLSAILMCAGCLALGSTCKSAAQCCTGTCTLNKCV
jgi:hypothetical protein